MMRILLNASNLHVGGAVQVASSLVEEAGRDGLGHEWLCATSRAVAANLPVGAGSPTSIEIDLVGRRWWAARRARRALSDAERAFAPDIVYSVFGPPHWRPAALHVCGVADPWVIFDGGRAWPTLSLPERLRMRAIIRAKGRALRRVPHFVVESAAARRGLGERLRVDGRRVHVVPNVPHGAFWRARAAGRLVERVRRPGRPFRILCLSAHYPHKNLESLPRIAAALAAMGLDEFELVATLAPESAAWARLLESARRLGQSRRFATVGVLRVEQCPDLCAAADCLLLPSVLECFSANYVEAAICGRPLVTTNIEAAREACGGAALLYEPFDDAGAAALLARLARDDVFYADALARLAAMRDRLLTARDRYARTVDVLERAVAAAHAGAGRARPVAAGAGVPR